MASTTTHFFEVMVSTTHFFVLFVLW
uniref:Uncharacterized protein n=1 Tax=Arundo donax TaxID=35708 RepID=A0A0A8ZE05_ARUDO